MTKVDVSATNIFQHKSIIPNRDESEPTVSNRDGSETDKPIKEDIINVRYDQIVGPPAEGFKPSAKPLIFRKTVRTPEDKDKMEKLRANYFVYLTKSRKIVDKKESDNKYLLFNKDMTFSQTNAAKVENFKRQWNFKKSRNLWAKYIKLRGTAISSEEKNDDLGNALEESEFDLMTEYLNRIRNDAIYEREMDQLTISHKIYEDAKELLKGKKNYLLKKMFLFLRQKIHWFRARNLWEKVVKAKRREDAASLIYEATRIRRLKSYIKPLNSKDAE